MLSPTWSTRFARAAGTGLPSICSVSGPPGLEDAAVLADGAASGSAVVDGAAAFSAALALGGVPAVDPEPGAASVPLFPSAGVQAMAQLTPKKNSCERVNHAERGAPMFAGRPGANFEARNTPHFAPSRVGQGKIPSVKQAAEREPELSKLPRVDHVLGRERIREAASRLGASWVKRQVREVLEELRAALIAGENAATDVESVERRLLQRLGAPPRLRDVINATGVVLHTGLGRAPLGRGVTEELSRLADYCDLELDLESGKRSKRGQQLAATLAAWLGAEACHFTGNNAGAVLLCLAEIAKGRDVLVSRGELIEIGGGFRIPEMLEVSGARLVEVGTTNRTRLADYERALSERTGCVLRVHPSNFRCEGFVQRPQLRELSELARRVGVPLIKDLGGGRVTELGALSLHEPSVQECLAAGADAVCFSLDKLFGGPQGGAIVGRAPLIERLRSHPLARVLRVGKLTLGALAPVVAAHVTGASQQVEVVRLLSVDMRALEARALRWLSALQDLRLELSVEATSGAVGGGTLPGVELPSWAPVVRGDRPDQLAEALRVGEPAVLARVWRGALWLDARTPALDQDAALLSAFRLAATGLSRAPAEA
ncbi:MAG: L-seryl-tRNA(Sec) selenium transferase [Myxococcales bacterium]|nr:L-seryl-tRNA(Sec) selenium transferase [Myxococcales bacterium]